jgi:NAD(P)-dependent dehydrogenase (short-subunit alcohol dehydrogenase family)
MDLQLKNKKVLVTGSTAGIGFATACLFAEEGAAGVRSVSRRGGCRGRFATGSSSISSSPR